MLGVNELCSWTLPLDVSIRLTQDVIISNLLSCALRITSCLPRRLNFLLLIPLLLPFYLFSLSRYNVISKSFNYQLYSTDFKLSTINFQLFLFLSLFLFLYSSAVTTSPSPFSPPRYTVLSHSASHSGDARRWCTIGSCLRL